MAVSLTELEDIMRKGEDSQNQFKKNITNVDSLASEIVAFSNTQGGNIFIGITDNGKAVGLQLKGVARINQLISNASSQHVRNPVAVTTSNILLENGNVVIALKIPEGINKPYFDKNGVIWLKSGADKRRINSKEELQRLFQSTGILYADEVPTKAEISRIDRDYFEKYLNISYDENIPKNDLELQKLLNNMNLAQGKSLNLAGLLLFGNKPQFIKPTFIIKSISYPGNDISIDSYVDSDDFEGKIEQIFKGAMVFISRNLYKVQNGRSVNSRGEPEIPKIVFEELLANALIHRNYFINAPIRLFVFRDRIELINPGCLPNHLTIEKIQAGNSNIRNPVLASFSFKGILPYRGLGTGIRRVKKYWEKVLFKDDRDANEFKVTILREEI